LSVLSCLSCNVGVLWPNGWIDQNVTWHTEVGLSQGHIVLDGDGRPSSRHGKGHSSPHTFAVQGRGKSDQSSRLATIDMGRGLYAGKPASM